MGAPPEMAFWIATAWTLIVVIAIVATQWEPRHSHPSQAHCPCRDCAVYRFRRR